MHYAASPKTLHTTHQREGAVDYTEVMGKLFVVVVLAAVVLAGLRLRSGYQLEERVAAYREGLRLRALASLPGADSVPSEDLIEERATALGQELALEVTELKATVTRGASPGGVAGMVAGQLGALEGTPDVDAQGSVAARPALSLRTTLVRVEAHVHAEGFLCSLDEQVSASANIGYALAP